MRVEPAPNSEYTPIIDCGLVPKPFSFRQSTVYCDLRRSGQELAKMIFVHEIIGPATAGPAGPPAMHMACISPWQLKSIEVT